MMYNSQYNSLQPKKFEHLCYEFLNFIGQIAGMVNQNKKEFLENKILKIKDIITQGFIIC
jgi:hypothetical protein